MSCGSSWGISCGCEGETGEAIDVECLSWGLIWLCILSSLEGVTTGR